MDGWTDRQAYKETDRDTGTDRQFSICIIHINEKINRFSF